MIKTDIGLSRLVVALNNEEIYEFLFSEFQRQCIRCRLGRDLRTTKSWLQTALVEGLIVKKCENERGDCIFSRGPNFEKFLNLKEEA